MTASAGSGARRSNAYEAHSPADARTALASVREDRAPLRVFNKALLAKLEKLGITCQLDLALHLPLRYDDETRLYRISEAPSAQPALVEGEVIECDVKYRPRRQLVCHLSDGSSVLTLRFFNFYPSQLKQLAAGVRVRAYGEVRQGFFGAEMVHPRYRIVRGEMPISEALTPVYPTTAGLAQDELRQMIHRAIGELPLADTLPHDLVSALGLPPFRDAVVFLHNPPPRVSQEALSQRRHPAWRRMKFDELLAQQLSMRLHYRRRKAAGAPQLPPLRRQTKQLLSRLPFKLTGAQQRALADIEHDLAQPYPMQRLLQGDVGSGKTIVAALAALQCVENGYQVAVMAPTEILAEQHYRKFAGWLEGTGVGVSWISGSLRKRDKSAALAAVAEGKTMIAVGTHALFQDEVRFRNLALAIVDEQHRFGVHQRLALRVKGTQPDKGAQPHQLMMSATPIPRTLAMSYYADLDVSVIDELPPGRTPVATRLVSESRRDEVIMRVRDACLEGSQAYWVCPLIEEAEPEAPGEDAQAPRRRRARAKARGPSEALQLKAAIETFETVRATFPELSVGLVHGRMKSDEKAAVMDAFQRGTVQLLVATTVIEVGVDVANATLMVIDHAERMGLSQLHQLRGRVGRGTERSTCILLYQNPLGGAARERLKIIYEN
ncbi:MAG TPA: ATP-dependent DNA helicase RecG, partial [Burkholderiales bacterium]|nr:ATP-dependent DNA helicase RecG [Burkholderiales bacterium]